MASTCRTKKPTAPALPAWLSSTAQLTGRISIARIDPRRLAILAGHLNTCRIDFFWPKERVRRYGASGWDEWDRSLFPGVLFVAGDADGWEEASDFARYFAWRLTWIRPVSNAAQDRLRFELTQVERLLQIDPTLSALNRISPGSRCRINAGAFMGMTGILTAELPRAEVQITITTLGDSIPLTVPREAVELL